MSLFPNGGIQTTNLGVVYTNALVAVPDGQAKADGLAWGQTVAGRILQLRANDGSAAIVAYTPGTQPGQWRPAPPGFAPALLPNWGQVTPFAMVSGSQFRPHPPPALSGSAYALEFDLVKAYGGATGSLRSADQSEIALFWLDGGGTETPPGHWNRIADDVAVARGLSLAEHARLMALLNLALADAAICAWDAKYAYSYWRPVAAIREADTDGNPATTADPAWTPFIATPPFPEYVSGHSTFSRAAATVLAGWYGTDAISFSTSSDGLPGVTRTFPGFSAAADESGISRIYGGIHFPSANIAGQTAGHLLGLHVAAHYLQPLRAPAFALVTPVGGSTQLKLIGEPGRDYVLQICPDLRSWVNVATNTAASNGEVLFADPQMGAAVKRFYRAVAR
jgi:membrane-associated phospholipid phosphatase